MEELMGCKVEEIFDAFIISSEVGIRKPNPEILNIVLSHFPGVKPHETLMVGDAIGADVLCAHLVGFRSVYFGLVPYSKKHNYEALREGIKPDFSMIDFRQLPHMVKVMNEDVKFIEA